MNQSKGTGSGDWEKQLQMLKMLEHISPSKLNPKPAPICSTPAVPAAGSRLGAARGGAQSWPCRGAAFELIRGCKQCLRALQDISNDKIVTI